MGRVFQAVLDARCPCRAPEATAAQLRALADVGTTSVAVCLVREVGGPPIGDARLLAGVGRVAEARALARG